MKAKILLLLTVVTFLTACETNDSNVSVTEADLIGTWNLKSQTIEDGTFNVTTQGQTLSANYSGLAEDIDFTYTFSTTPNQLDSQGRYNFTASINFFGQTETEEEEINTDVFPIPSVNWSLNGDSITITEGSNELPAILNIIEFSSNFMKLRGEIDESETFDGETIATKATIYIELEK